MIFNIGTITSIFFKAVPYLKKYWKSIVIGAVIIFGIIHYNSVINERDDLREEVSKKEYIIDEFKKNEEEYQNLISEQNTSIDNLEKESNRLLERKEEAEREIRKIRNERQSDVIDLSTQVVPQDCDGAMNWLLDFYIDN